VATQTTENRIKLNVLGSSVEHEVDTELARFEAQERARLGLDKSHQQWEDKNPNVFSVEDRATTTLFIAGLTRAHDRFVQAGLSAAGFRVQTLDCPDNEALRFGKEFGNRGQCNPTYFTVGNLIKYLTYLRDEKGMSSEDIVRRYVFMTAGACGPCRFGMYVTEYRKALRDSGFEGFRVLLVSQGGGVHAASGGGLEMSKRDITWVFRGIMMGDVLNALMYRIRPYEVESGATDAAIAACRDVIAHALETRKSLLKAAWRCRRILSRVQVDRTRVKPKVAIIGEFWAMTTEGDGNYRLQRFLEEEGAEVDIQLVTNWLLYLISEKRWDTEKRAGLRNHDACGRGLKTVDVRKKLVGLWIADILMRLQLQTYAKIMGLHKYSLPNFKELGDISHRHYDMHLRGGESYLEVGKVIHNVVHNKVNMTVSVKPFGCMPSSGVSDGVQSLVTELYPHAIFLAIETSGDAAVNVYSRVQMQLFKAKQAALKEFDQALEGYGMSRDEFERHFADHAALRRSLHRSSHVAGCTAVDLVHEVARRMGRAKIVS
jgi:predicted nucleotide-binding protein (sugar kinase/HSP70/actin superfamily)